MGAIISLGASEAHICHLIQMIGNTQQFDADVGQAIFLHRLQEMKEQKRNEKRQRKLLEKGPPQWTWKHLATVPGAGK